MEWIGQWLLVCFADDTVLLAENEWELLRVVDQFYSVCAHYKEVEVVNFWNPYRVSVPVDERCEIVMGDEKMEVVKEFKYLGTVLSKQKEMEGEVRERAVKGRSVIGSLVRVMRGRTVSMEVKIGLWNSILFPTLMYESDITVE